MDTREKIQLVHRDIINHFDSNTNIYEYNRINNSKINNIINKYNEIFFNKDCLSINEQKLNKCMINLSENNKNEQVFYEMKTKQNKIIKEKLYELHNYISLYLLDIDK
jgi:hypothetical protein